MRNRLFKIAEDLGWGVLEDDNYVTFVNASPAGEDISFTVDRYNIKNEIAEYCVGFDIDEHIEMWIDAKRNGISGVPSISELVQDASNIKEMLECLNDAVHKPISKKEF